MTGAGDDVDPYVPGRGNPGYRVSHYDLDLDYAISSNRLAGTARIATVALEPRRRLTLDLVGMRVLRVTANGLPARWRQRPDKVDIDLPGPVEAGDGVHLDVRYSGNPQPTSSPWGRLGWEELSDGVLVASQPSGSPTWFPCNDLAAQKATFRVRVRAASSYRVLVNGELVDRQPHGSTTTWTYEQSEPTSPYLLTFHLGRYECDVVTASPVAIRAVLPAALRRPFADAFSRQSQMMEVFVEAFGPYPFRSGYTVVVTPDPLELPLEAQGQAIFGSNHLDGTVERLIAHELAHQWFGNSLTAARWRDVWLHEGFACYAEWLWSERSGGDDADAHALLHHRRLASLPQDLVLAEPGPADMFDDRVYKRGALCLHALRRALGDGPFHTLLRRWTATHQHGLVTTEGFVTMAEAAAGRPLDDVFDAWLRRAVLPAPPG